MEDNDAERKNILQDGGRGMVWKQQWGPYPNAEICEFREINRLYWREQEGGKRNYSQSRARVQFKAVGLDFFLDSSERHLRICCKS